MKSCICGFCSPWTPLPPWLNKRIKFLKFWQKRVFLSYRPEILYHRSSVSLSTRFVRSRSVIQLVAKDESSSSGSENAVSLTVDGGVQKKILKEGFGDYVKSGSRVAVHYTGYFDDGREFDSTRKRLEPFRFVVDKGQVIRGWDIALLSMKEGETATVRCSPSYAYGEKGVPPYIPPNAFLTFEIQLIKVEGLTDSSMKDKNIANAEATSIKAAKSKADRKPLSEKFYFISPFASQTGERAPWWLNPIITFSVIFLLVGIAFAIVVQSGALHTSYLKDT